MVDIENYELKPCPFCGSTKFEISNKGNHIAVFCRSCYTYGPRVLEYGLKDKDGSYWKRHWFKNLKDQRANTEKREFGGDVFVNNTNAEISHDWYEEEAIKKWNERC